jgi:uncharacterized protein (TIGR02246 family)
MSIDPVALLKRYHAALNTYDAVVVAPMFAAGAVYVSPGVSGRIEGRDAIIAAFSAYFAEHPDQHAEDEEVSLLSATEARAVWRLTATSASKGEPVSRRGLETIRFDEAGQILAVEVVDQ